MLMRNELHVGFYIYTHCRNADATDLIKFKSNLISVHIVVNAFTNTVHCSQDVGMQTGYL